MSRNNVEIKEKKVTIMVWSGGYTPEGIYRQKGIYEASERIDHITGNNIPRFDRRIFSADTSPMRKQAPSTTVTGFIVQSKHLDGKFPSR